MANHKNIIYVKGIARVNLINKFRNDAEIKRMTAENKAIFDTVVDAIKEMSANSTPTEKGENIYALYRDGNAWNVAKYTESNVAGSTDWEAIARELAEKCGVNIDTMAKTHKKPGTVRRTISKATTKESLAILAENDLYE